MNAFKKVWGAIQIEEFVLYGFSFAFLILNVAFFPNPISINKALHLMFDYLLAGDQAYTALFLFIYVFYIVQAGIFLDKKNHDHSKPRKITRIEVFRFFKVFFSSLRFIFPIAFFSVTFYSLLQNASILLRFSGNDLLFLSWDEKIFSTAPFFYLWEHLSGWWPNIAWYSYMSLSWFFGFLFILGFYFSRTNYYKKILLSFVTILVLALPFWLVLPCQDPYNSLVLKRHNTVIPRSVQEKVDQMPSTARNGGYILSSSESDASHDDVVPISCFPSMHAGWSFVVVFFAFLFSPWTLLVTLPWTASLLLGGLYYGQHYAVDYLMALPITAFAIFLSFFLVNLEAKQRKKKAGKADTEQPTETPIR